MICILHGWLLEGSGSNLWTRSIVTALARAGETVHLVCQENHPDLYEAIGEAWRYNASGAREQTLVRDVRMLSPRHVLRWHGREHRRGVDGSTA
jgi:hypothetical protein